MIRVVHLFAIFTLIFVVNVALAMTSSEDSNGEKAISIYNNPDHGSLRFDVPNTWNREFRQSQKKETETLIFTPKSGNSFKLMIDPLVKEGHTINFKNQEIAKRQVEQLGNQMLPHAIEKQLDIGEVKGNYSTGYYFSLTDRAPKSGEWECLTQGRIGVGVYLLHFTIFTHSFEAIEINESLEALGTAQYFERKHNMSLDSSAD